ncbi:MAG: hypothetical protein NTX99_10005, partial [Candidatus Aminicenantes bacterium]|nr:hypothetical protein [Candidatus Aminicenantes bacterium]
FQDEFSLNKPEKQGFSPITSRLAQAVLKALPEGLGRRPIGRPFSQPDPHQSQEKPWKIPIDLGKRLGFKKCLTSRVLSSIV